MTISTKVRHLAAMCLVALTVNSASYSQVKLTRYPQAKPEEVNSQKAQSYELVLPALNFKGRWNSKFLLTHIEGEKLALNINAYAAASTIPVLSSTQNLKKNKTTALDDSVGPDTLQYLTTVAKGAYAGSTLFYSRDRQKSEVIPAINSGSTTLAFPRLASGAADKTLLVINRHDVSASITVQLYDEVGSKIGDLALPMLLPKESRFIHLQDVFEAALLNRAGLSVILSDSVLVGVQVEDSTDYDVVALPALTTSGTMWTLPIISTSGALELATKVGATNLGDTEATVNITALDARGEFLGTVGELTVAPRATGYVATSNLRGTIPDTAASVTLSSDQPVAVFEVFEVLNGKGRAAVPALSPQDERQMGIEVWGSPDGSFLNAYILTKRADDSTRSIGTEVSKYGWLLDHRDLANAQFVTTTDSEITAQVNSCGGHYSQYNPYPCGNGGNCTWWAWYMAQSNWGVNLPSWGNAKSWAGYATNAGYSVLSGIPAPNTIGVNTWQTTGGIAYGHVAWVLQVSGDSVYVSEMYYGVSGRYYRWRPSSYFNGGYIFPKSSAPAPIISWIYPNSPWAASYNQDVNVMGYNFSVPEMVQVFFPTSGSTVLRGAQIPYYGYNMFTMRITLGRSGTWAIRAINRDGKLSNKFYFTVR